MRLSRRNFLKHSGLATAAVAAPWIVPASALGLNGSVAPSERIVVGCIGVGPQGNHVLGNFLSHREAQIVAVCDVKRPAREDTKKRIDDHYGNQDCAAYGDFRELLARDDIDAVSIASTDHWHVLHTIHAARAGKDMYVEKPLAVTIAELKATRDAVHRYGRIFQFGTQQRSSRIFRFSCELVHNKLIGDLHSIKVGAPASIKSDNFGETPIPDWIDYDMWLGPAQWSPFNENRVSNSYWWHVSDYAIGFISGWGIHHIDIAQWGNGTELTGPVEIAGTGVFPTDGMCDCALRWNVDLFYENGVRVNYTDDGQNTHGITFEGTDGWVYVRRSYMDTHPKSLMTYALKPDDIHLYESDDHVGNFLDCVRSRRQTVCPIDIAVRTDTICQLSDIAIRTGRPLKWDPAAERFSNDDEANRLMARAMREPWRL